MPFGPNRPQAPRPQNWPSERAARSSWARPCTPAISTASSSCSAERWVPPRAPALRRPRRAFSYPPDSSWPGPARLGIARPCLAWLRSALPNSPPDVPGASGARHLPAEPGSQQLRRGRGPLAPSPSSERPVEGNWGEPGLGGGLRILSRQPGRGQGGEPLPSVLPTPSPIPLLATARWDRECRFCSELLCRGLKSFLLRPRWWLTQRAPWRAGLFLLFLHRDPQIHPPAACPPPAT